jgi:hypothetical protein
MRFTPPLIVALMLFVGAAVGGAAEKPPADYQKAMKELGAASNTLRVNIKNLDYPAIEKDASVMKAAFDLVTVYWKARNVADALALAEAGAKGAADLGVAAKAQNLPAVLDAQAAMSGSPSTGTVGLIGTCAPCHLAHRVRLPDGTFEIK